MPLPKKSTNRNASLPSLDEDFQSVQIETVADEEPSYTNSLPVQESMEDDSHLYATHEEPIYENSKEEKKKKKFIDKKKKKIKPFGNKVSKYDERKDVAVAKKVQRGLVLGGILIIIALGVKNTFFPANSYTTDEIAQIAKTIEKEEGLEVPLYLSMGMSGDFETAIECGATHIRIGTSWFEREED